MDVNALRARGIPLLLPGAANAVAVAEQTMLHMLAVARKLTEYDQEARAGNYNIRNRNDLISLANKTVFTLLNVQNCLLRLATSSGPPLGWVASRTRLG